jgi:oligopeptide/dipeptide ABC transporter ATP-binding protein
MIALSILHHPQILIADEPTTALDPTIKWGILNLLKDLKENCGLTLFIISHDIPYVSKICDQIAVIYKGLLLEISNAHELLKNPLHPYTQELLNKETPNLSSKKENLKYDIETGCPYTNRCPHVKPVCSEKLPPLFEPQKEHLVRCWLYDD